jgi:hypothetical protein
MKMQTKLTLSYCCIALRLANIKSFRSRKVTAIGSKDIETKNIFMICCGIKFSVYFFDTKCIFLPISKTLSLSSKSPRSLFVSLHQVSLWFPKVKSQINLNIGYWFPTQSHVTIKKQEKLQNKLPFRKEQSKQHSAVNGPWQIANPPGQEW